MQSMSQKEWIVARPAPDEHLHRYHNISPVLAQLLYNRGFEDPDQAGRFLSASDLIEDPFDMKDMRKAVKRICSAIAARESIAVYGDFDADGVTATTLLVQVLSALGADVQPYIPDRVEEGYGLNSPALQGLAAAGISLVVTVDCGIRSVDEIEAGLRFGLDIIVTDHHSIGPEIPRALAIINPQQECCGGNASLAGVGVAYMLAKALLINRWQNDRDNYPHDLRESDLLDLVAIGTVADLVALNDGQNRRLVRHGLNAINDSRRPGIVSLAKVARLLPGKISSADIGFMLGPRINAAGRLGTAMTAYHLLSAPSKEEAEPYALELQRLNAQRQQLTRQAQAAISDQIAELDDVNLIFAGDESLLPGIVGLVAGRLTEEFYRPAVVLEYGEEESRASCRSIPEFNITHALDECADLLLRHGGHAMAAGFTVRNGNLYALRQALEEKAARSLEGQSLRRRIQLDLEIDERYLSEDLANELMQLEPTGHANPPASFLSRNMGVISCRRVGDEGRHLKLKIAREESAPIDAIGFGLGGWAKQMPGAIDAAYNLEMNEWNGRRSMQLKLVDIRPAQAQA